MPDIALSPVTPVTNGDIVKASNPLPVIVIGGNVSLIKGASGTAASVTGTTDETVLKSVAIPAMGPNDIIRVMSLWTWTNNGNTKTVRVRLGGLLGTAHTAVSATTTASAQVFTVIYNNNATNSQKGILANSTGLSAGTSIALVTGAVQTNAGTTLDFTGQLGVGTDTVTLQGCIVELIRGS